MRGSISKDEYIDNLKQQVADLTAERNRLRVDLDRATRTYHEDLVRLMDERDALQATITRTR